MIKKYLNPSEGIQRNDEPDVGLFPIGLLWLQGKQWFSDNVVLPVARFIDSYDPSSPNYRGNITDALRQKNARRRANTNPTYADIIKKGLSAGFNAGLFYEGFTPMYTNEALGTRTYMKPWRSDPSKSNEATAVFLRNDPLNYFEVVKDMEPGYYSVHFKTQRGLPEWLKLRLFQGLIKLLPEEAKVSTWGTVSPGGFSALRRLQHQFGLKPSGETRIVGMKVPERHPVFGHRVGPDLTEIPVLWKTNGPGYILLPTTSHLTLAERMGIPKGDRGNLSINLQQALEDLAQYINSGQRRQVFRVTPDWEDFGWDLDISNPTFMLLFVKDGMVGRGPFARVTVQTPTGKGVLSWNPEHNMGDYSSRSFSIPNGLLYAPGEAHMMLEGPNLKIILTSPRIDAQDYMEVLRLGSAEELALFKSLDAELKRTIDKNIMKDFWINARKMQRPGSYLSGDNGTPPLGSKLIEAYKKRQLYKTPVLERPLKDQFVIRDGLSPDSYSSIIRLGNRDGSLRWGEGFVKWNNSAIENRSIFEAFEQLQKGLITPEQYESIFNTWSQEIGGRPLLWVIKNGRHIPVHPHPYIFAKKLGGKLNTD